MILPTELIGAPTKTITLKKGDEIPVGCSVVCECGEEHRILMTSNLTFMFYVCVGPVRISGNGYLSLASLEVTL